MLDSVLARAHAEILLRGASVPRGGYIFLSRDHVGLSIYSYLAPRTNAREVPISPGMHLSAELFLKTVAPNSTFVDLYISFLDDGSIEVDFVSVSRSGFRAACVI